MTEDITTDRCDRCGEQIATDVQKCPKCGNHPAKSAKWSGIAMMVAGLFMVWLPPVALVLLLLGLAITLGGRTLKPIDHDFGGGD